MTKPYKVFGIGLNKTGTSSLKAALVELGFNHCPFRGRMTFQFFAGNIDTVLETTEDFESFEDWPWPLMYRELFAKYGDSARYVLTTRRSSEAWLESLKRHSEGTSPDNNRRKKIYGFDYPHGAEAQHMAFYEKHLQGVRQFFAQNNASHLLCELCWETGDGWAELCKFLREPAPSGAFPHANKGGDGPHKALNLSENQFRIDKQLQRLGVET